jgi:hypothetical protein
LSNVTRSTGWITTEYNDQNSHPRFYSVGGQQSQGGGGTITITMASSPPGLSLTVDGGSCTQPSCTNQWNPGSSHTIAAPSPQTHSFGAALIMSADGGSYDFTVNSNQVVGGSTNITTWRYVTGTWDGSNGRLYVDGTLVQTTAINASSLGGSYPVILGDILSFGYQGIFI